LEVGNETNKIRINCCRQYLGTAKRVQIMMKLFEVGNKETKFPRSSTQ